MEHRSVCYECDSWCTNFCVSEIKYIHLNVAKATAELPINFPNHLSWSIHVPNLKYGFFSVVVTFLLFSNVMKVMFIQFLILFIHQSYYTLHCVIIQCNDLSNFFQLCLFELTINHSLCLEAEGSLHSLIFLFIIQTSH